MPALLRPPRRSTPASPPSADRTGLAIVSGGGGPTAGRARVGGAGGVRTVGGESSRSTTAVSCATTSCTSGASGSTQRRSVTPWWANATTRGWHSSSVRTTRPRPDGRSPGRWDRARPAPRLRPACARSTRARSGPTARRSRTHQHFRPAHHAGDVGRRHLVVDPDHVDPGEIAQPGQPTRRVGLVGTTTPSRTSRPGGGVTAGATRQPLLLVRPSRPAISLRHLARPSRWPSVSGFGDRARSSVRRAHERAASAPSVASQPMGAAADDHDVDQAGAAVLAMLLRLLGRAARRPRRRGHGRGARCRRGAPPPRPDRPERAAPGPAGHAGEAPRGRGAVRRAVRPLLPADPARRGPDRCRDDRRGRRP